MIGDLIDEEEESMHWENFTTLLMILDFVLSSYTTVADANLVASLTQDLLAEFKELYPYQPLTLKMHYNNNTSAILDEHVSVSLQLKLLGDYSLCFDHYHNYVGVSR